jgi:hypothetical protein
LEFILYPITPSIATSGIDKSITYSNTYIKKNKNKFSRTG